MKTQDVLTRNIKLEHSLLIDTAASMLDANVAAIEITPSTQSFTTEDEINRAVERH